VISQHGTPGSRLLSARRLENEFEEVLRKVGIRLITYDRPGYGGSDRQHGRRIADSAGDVAQVASAVGVERFGLEGSSSGSAHALAVAALLPQRIERVAISAPMAPFDALGRADWSRGQEKGVLEYVGSCLDGEARMVVEFERERADSGTDAPPDFVEATRQGVGGWVDDELAAFRPWGFEVGSVRVPVAVWYDPRETVLPAQHAEWLAGASQGAVLTASDALGHGSQGDPRPEWTRLFSWLSA
jgi:pimeloyl-ACP methyl ester carboxylesterase